MSVDPVGVLGELIQRATVAVFGADHAGVDALVRRSDHADLQSDLAFGLARTLRRSPPAIAQQIAAALPPNDLVERAATGGGYINVTLRTDWLAAALDRARADARLGIARTHAPERVVIDYSAPNVAKEMHVGHLRSTIIGDALARILEHRGHTVIRQNHLGDWGTPFGMLIEQMLACGVDPAAPSDIATLTAIYRAGSERFRDDAAFGELARARVVALQAGDPQTVRWWRALVALSHDYIAGVYRALDVTLAPADTCPESFYNPQLVPLADELADSGATLSNGALCVFPAGFVGRDGEPLPLIVRKRDGGFGYATTDLAALRYRIRELHATRLLYVVGAPQARHLAMLFAAATELGWLAPPVRAEHVAFGSVLGPDGKMLRTRNGEPVSLQGLIADAIAAADAATRERSPDLAPARRAEVARIVGIGSLKYADLSCDRIKDYEFDLARMVSFQGATAGYLQYAHARCCSILRDAGAAAGPVVLGDPHERALGFALLGLGQVLADVERTLEPHRLVGFAHGVAERFTGFYEHCPILRSEGPVRGSRLALVELTARTIAAACGLLGISVPDQM